MKKNYNKKILGIIDDYKAYIKTSSITNGRYFNFVFLCGAERSEGDNRSNINMILSDRKDIRCLYSEELFTVLASRDLLTFEEILSELSVAVIIVVESWGSACELGAFTYVDGALDKILVVNDRKHIDSKSFINSGPIRKIKENFPDHVYYEQFDNNPLKPDSRKLILSTNLVNGLKKQIPLERTFKKDAVIVKDKILKINSIEYLQLIIIDLVKFFGYLEIDMIAPIIMNSYEVNEIEISFKSGNKISSVKDSKKFTDIICLLFKVLEKFGVLFVKEDKLFINYSNILRKDLSYKEPSSVLLNFDFLKSKEHLRAKSKAYNLAKKEGVRIWVE